MRSNSAMLHQLQTFVEARVAHNSRNLVLSTSIYRQQLFLPAPVSAKKYGSPGSSHGRHPACTVAAVSSPEQATVVSVPTNGELLREGQDPGSWGYSPEWMGTQAGGWGHNKGEIIFDATSAHGNGRVWVTQHYASKQDTAFGLGGAEGSEAPQAWFQEWRVLRFNDETRQSVARVTVSRDAGGRVTVRQQPDCLAFLYMKTLAATVAAQIGLSPEGSSLAAAVHVPTTSSDGFQICRVLCIGLGGGSLPLFLAHHFLGMSIDVVEIDPVVIAAARQAMGFSDTSERIRVHEGDAIRWLKEHVAEGGPPFDVVFVDAFDGENFIPDEFTELSKSFLPCLARALHPEHGIALLNAHRGELPPLWKQVALKITGQPWLDPIVTPMAQAYKDALLSTGEGMAYMLGVGKQYNTVAVVARGKHFSAMADIPTEIATAAEAVGRSAGFRFQAAKRAIMDLVAVPDS